jgi:hypothetical protein
MSVSISVSVSVTVSVFVCIFVSVSIYVSIKYGATNIFADMAIIQLISKDVRGGAET